MSYMYMRKHHKRTVQSGGASPDGKIPLSIDDKGGEIYQMQRTEVDLSDAEDRGMVLGGA
jgi:hypothetical protein